MIIGNQLYLLPEEDSFVPPLDSLPGSPVTRKGGVALGNSSQGHEIKDYTLTYSKVSGDFTLTTLGFTTILINVPDVSNYSFDFDQNMNPLIVYETNDDPGSLFLYWFDPIAAGYVTTSFLGARDAKMFHDDRREISRNTSDVLIFFIRLSDNRLCHRRQRDRFSVVFENQELLADEKLLRIGFTNGRRVRVQVGRVVNP